MPHEKIILGEPTRERVKTELLRMAPEAAKEFTKMLRVIGSKVTEEQTLKNILTCIDGACPACTTGGVEVSIPTSGINGYWHGDISLLHSFSVDLEPARYARDIIEERSRAHAFELYHALRDVLYPPHGKFTDKESMLAAARKVIATVDDVEVIQK